MPGSLSSGTCRTGWLKSTLSLHARCPPPHPPAHRNPPAEDRLPQISLPFETWRAVIDELRAEGLPPWMREHADRLERALDEHGPGEAEVALRLSDDVYLRSYNHARLRLGLPLPPPER